MSADPLETILAELRALSAGTDDIKERLDTIDATLTTLPSGKEVDALKKIVHTLQSDMTEVMSFIHGDPPLKDRLVALEQNVAAFKEATGVSEQKIARDAGTADDPSHRASIHGIIDPAFAAAAVERVELRHVGQQEHAEIRQSVVDSEARGMERVGTIRDRLNELVPAIKEIQSTTLLLLTVGSLTGAVVLFILVRALGF